MIKKILYIALGMLVASTAGADCRLNEQDGNKKMHVPYSSQDTDREFRVHSFKGGSTPLEGDNDARQATAHTYIGFHRISDAPTELQNLGVNRMIWVSDGGTGETCAYTDTDGNQYALPEWRATVRRMAQDESDFSLPRGWAYYQLTLSAYGTSADKIE